MQPGGGGGVSHLKKTFKGVAGEEAQGVLRFMGFIRFTKKGGRGGGGGSPI